MNESELRTDVKDPSGVYFFYGAEDYMKNHYAAQIKKAAITDESFASFNYLRITDDIFTVSAVQDAIAAPPVMSDKKVADISLAVFDRVLDEKGRNLLCDILAEAAEDAQTVVIFRISADGFDAGTPKKPSAFLKKMSAFAKVVQFDYQSDARLYKWMERHFAEYGLSVTPDVCAAILASCGRSMYRLTGEIAKLAAYTAESGMPAVTLREAREVISRTDEDDAFRLADCILSGDVHAALEALAVKKFKKEDPILLLGQINKAFCDLAAAAHALEEGMSQADFAKMMGMHPYRAGLMLNAARTKPVKYFDSAVERCAEADRKIKSTPLAYEAIERLICG